MHSFSPQFFAAVVVTLTAITTGLIVTVQNRRKFRGYEQYADDARRLRTKLKGELFRDGEDLVVSGNYGKIPTIIRLSTRMEAPGVSIEMRVPVTFSLSIFPKQVITHATGSPVPLGNRKFATRCKAVSKNPTEARLLLSAKDAQDVLDSLCSSSDVGVELSKGVLSVVTLLIPQNFGSQVSEQLELCTRMDAIVESLPGSHAVKIVPIEHRKPSWVFRAAMASGAVICALCLIASSRELADSQTTVAAAQRVSNGVAPVDAQVIPKVADWRAAQAEDMDPSFLTTLRNAGAKTEYPVTFDTDGSGERPGTAYLLIGPDGSKRVVAIVNHRVAFDVVFPDIAGIAVIPKESVASVEWATQNMQVPNTGGDGLLFVRNGHDGTSANLLLFAQNSVFSAPPNDYRKLSLQ
jgi:hypothetical protein